MDLPVGAGSRDEEEASAGVQLHAAWRRLPAALPAERCPVLRTVSSEGSADSSGGSEATEPGVASDLTRHLCCRDVKRVLFVPYALHDRDAYTKTARDTFRTLGLSRLLAAEPPEPPEPLKTLLSLTPAGYEVDGIHEAPDPVEAVRRAEAIFIGEEVRSRLHTTDPDSTSCLQEEETRSVS